jgi:AraC-like DNA-binding protein
MITFNSTFRKFTPTSINGTPSNQVSGHSAWFFEPRKDTGETTASTRVDAIFVEVESPSKNLDLLVADIANLARSYLSPAETGAPKAKLDSAVQSCNDLPASPEDDEAQLLDTVRSLLDDALQKMRASSRTATGDPSAAVQRPRGGIAPSALRRVREHIDQNLGEHIEIADLANLTGLSPCHFSRAFKQSMGVPPHRYLISRRVEEAARLIESTDRPMFEIALDVGFSDQSHFTRVFSSQVGESPSQFRHQRR